VVEDLPAWTRYTGQSCQEMQGWGWAKALHPDDVEHTAKIWRHAVAGKKSYETEYRLRRHDGVYRHFLARGVPSLKEDGSIREWVGTCIDITARKVAEEELRRLNRTLRAQGKSNQALMRTQSETELLHEVCRIIVNDCGHALAWIGYAEEDAAKSIRPVAWAGFEAGYLETLRLTWAPPAPPFEPRSQACAGTCSPTPSSRPGGRRRSSAVTPPRSRCR
jgi:PAS domain S-box-containing protein